MTTISFVTKQSGNDQAKSALAPLRHPMFRWLWIAAVISNIGTWMQNVGAAWVMTDLTQNATLIALLQTASALPTVLFSLPAGTLADIIDRRRFMIALQILTLIAATGLTIYYFADCLTPTWLLSFTFLIAAGGAIMAPAWFASTPELVSPEDLQEAVTLNGIGVNVARAIGPAIAGLFISFWGAGITFALNAVSFAIMLPPLVKWKREAKPSQLPTERFISGMRAGLRFARHYPPLQRVCLHAFLSLFFGSSLWALLPIVVRQKFNQGAGGYGLMLGALGVGALATAFILPILRAKLHRQQIMQGASLLYAASIFVLTLTTHPWLAGIILFMAGSCWVAIVSTLHVSSQQLLPDWVRGRALAIYLTIFFAGMSLGSLAWGKLAGMKGVDFSLSASALGLAATVVALIAVKLPTIRQESLKPSQHWEALAYSGYTAHADVPVMVTIEYHVKPEEQTAFLKRLRSLEKIRKRDGAFFWQAYIDMEDTTHITEQFMVESLIEHMRQHDRVSHADKEIQDDLLRFHSGPQPPRVRHRLAAYERWKA